MPRNQSLHTQPHAEAVMWHTLSVYRAHSTEFNHLIGSLKWQSSSKVDQFSCLFAFNSNQFVCGLIWYICNLNLHRWNRHGWTEIMIWRAVKLEFFFENAFAKQVLVTEVFELLKVPRARHLSNLHTKNPFVLWNVDPGCHINPLVICLRLHIPGKCRVDTISTTRKLFHQMDTSVPYLIFVNVFVF